MLSDTHQIYLVYIAFSAFYWLDSINDIQLVRILLKPFATASLETFL